MPQIAETPAIPGLHYGFGASATHYAVITVGYGILGTLFGPIGGYFAGRLGPRMPMIVALAAWETLVARRVPFAALAATAATWLIFQTLPGLADPDMQALAFLLVAVPALAALARIVFRPAPAARTVAATAVSRPRAAAW